jgi:hypothetical protein
MDLQDSPVMLHRLREQRLEQFGRPGDALRSPESAVAVGDQVYFAGKQSMNARSRPSTAQHDGYRLLPIPGEEVLLELRVHRRRQAQCYFLH